jgi:hypothetical protein
MLPRRRVSEYPRKLESPEQNAENKSHLHVLWSSYAARAGSRCLRLSVLLIPSIRVVGAARNMRFGGRDP